MATETTVAREGKVNPINASNKPMTRTRQRNAVLNAKVEPSEGWTNINLGNGQSVQINVHYMNRSRGTITGQLNLNSGMGSNRFQFGGTTGTSFEDALRKVKKDIVDNI